ncbi:MAG TPA: alkaline shock response membrane anchor protein AmaP [Candidatus Coprousia avicola]|nr:alkaline shock response membrane anchor protein AmaP [Candidatus Coprousia avicola]
MRVIKKIGALLYLLAAIVVLGLVTGLTYGPFTARFERLLDNAAVQVVLAVCLVALALGALITVLAIFLARREPVCLHPGGNPDIEVSIAALKATATTAAEREGVLVESVTGRIFGRDHDQVRFTVETIALTDEELAPLAKRVQDAIERACEETLGTPGVTALVRFLPAKTTVVTKEVSRER